MNKRHPFPVRVRTMHGMAAMLAASQDLSSLGMHTGEGGAKIDTSQMKDPPAPDADKMAKGLAVFIALAKAEQKLANVEKVIAAFGVQVAALPAEHPMRVSVEKMLQTFRDCIDAVA